MTVALRALDLRSYKALTCLLVDEAAEGSD